MSKNFFRRPFVIALFVSAIIPFSTLHAQTVLEQLQAQYPFARGTDGCHIGNPETALVTQSAGGGMRILPVSSEMKIAKCVNSFSDGKLTPANSACNGESIGKVGGWMSHIPGRVGNAAGAARHGADPGLAGILPGLPSAAVGRRVHRRTAPFHRNPGPWLHRMLYASCAVRRILATYGRDHGEEADTWTFTSSMTAGWPSWWLYSSV